MQISIAANPYGRQFQPHNVTVRVLEPAAARRVDHDAEMYGPADDEEAESTSFEVETSQHDTWPFEPTPSARPPHG